MHFKGYYNKIAVQTKQKCLWVLKDLEQGKEDCFEGKKKKIKKKKLLRAINNHKWDT